LKHVITTVPSEHWKGVRSKRSLRSGVQLSNVLGLTWKTGNDEEVMDELRSLRPDVPILDVDNGFGYTSLEDVSPWSIGLLGLGVESGHEHYHRTVRTLNPNLPKEEILKILENVAETGITRAKGEIPGHELSFDIVNGKLVVNDNVSRGELPYIVLIDDNEPKPALEILREHEVTGEDLPFTSQGATKEETLGIFSYYQSRSEGVSPVVDGVVQANYETDEAYSAAKEIALRHGDYNPLRLFLPEYLGIRYSGLKALETSKQENKAYTGVMLGSFSLQMLDEWDGIPFYELIDPEDEKRLKEEVAPEYFEYLADYSDSDLDYVRSADQYSRYFHLMATKAAPYATKEARRTAAENMISVYDNAGKTEIADLWRDSLADDFGTGGSK
jgi:hypothetical protein